MAVAACATVLTLATVPASAQSPPDESRLTGAFLYRFARFVEWPPSALETQPAVNLCVTGPRPTRRFLDDVTTGETIGGRPLSVVYATPENVSACHVLFLGDNASRRALLRQVTDRPVLTISNAPAFLDEGGIVLLRLTDNRVSFEIDADAARRANLRLHTQLLRLASHVRRGAMP